MANYAGQKSDLGRWSAGSELNTDADLRLQYWGGWGINSQLEDVIYRDMIAYREAPRNLFTGSSQQLQQLMLSLGFTEAR